MARFSAIYTTSGNYLHPSIVVHYKTVRNNNLLCKFIVLIQIIKWMSPYRDNKALPNPTRYFIFNFLIISFIFIENKCLSDAIWDLKREKKSSAKGEFELGSIVSKSMCFTIYATEADVKWVSFFSVDCPNHTLVGGVSVNSLCQQGGLFALSVNRHSVFLFICMTDKYELH